MDRICVANTNCRNSLKRCKSPVRRILSSMIWLSLQVRMRQTIGKRALPVPCSFVCRDLAAVSAKTAVANALAALIFSKNEMV